MKKLFKKKWLKNLLVGLLSIVIIVIILQVIPPKKVLDNNPFIKSKDQGVMIAAHRGGSELNPENTFKAFDFSIENYDVDVLEIDVVMTKDNYLVLSHDDTLNRTSDIVEITGDVRLHYICDYNLEELRNLNFGYKFTSREGNNPYRDLVSFDDANRKQIIKDNGLNILTINEIVNKYKETSLLFTVEIKDAKEVGKRAVDYLNELILEYNIADRFTVVTFHDEISSYLRNTYPKILRGGSVGDVTGFILTQMFGINLFNSKDFACLQIPTAENLGLIKLRLDKLTYVNRAHRRGMSVQFWTINDKEEMRRLIKLGADVIITDAPDILDELLHEMGYR